MIELHVAGMVIGIFAISLVLKTENKVIQKRFFVAILLLWVLRFFFYYQKSTELYELYPGIILFDQNLFFLDGVLLFLYTQSFLTEKTNWLKTSLHFIPFLLACFLSINSFQNVSSDELIEIYRNAGNSTSNSSVEELVFILFIVIHNLIYLWKSRINVKRYNQLLLNNYSSIAAIQVRWLTNLINFWLLLFLLPLLLYFINYSFGNISLGLMSIAFTVTMVLSIFAFSFYGIHQEYVTLSVKTSKELKGKNLNITTDELKSLKANFEKLNLFMQQHQAFLDPLLSLDKLADQIGMKATEVSKSINRVGHINFYEFVNSFRVKKIQEELLTSDEQVIQIAYKNGFNSKSSFYEAFRNISKMTPAQYRKKFGPKK
jgi:AraC-like DNA-binding protein